MTDGSGRAIYLVQEARRNDTKPLRAFPTREAAEKWRANHVEQYEELDDKDWADFYLGRGAKAVFTITEVPYVTE